MGIKNTNETPELGDNKQDNTGRKNFKRIIIATSLVIFFLLYLFLVIISAVNQPLITTTNYQKSANKNLVLETTTPITTNQEHNRTPDVIVIDKEYTKIHEPEFIEEVISDAENNDIYNIYKLYKLGEITGGEFTNYEVIQLEISGRQVCKSSNCGRPFYLRMVKNGDNVFFTTTDDYTNSQDRILTNIIQPKKMVLDLSKVFELEIFKYPDEHIIEGGTLKFIREETGKPNNKLYIVSNDSVLGNIYTNNIKHSPQEPFYDNEEENTVKYGIHTCIEEECFNTNGFYVFLPDGKFLIYKYTPDDFIHTIKINDLDYKINSGYEENPYYYSQTRFGCSQDTADYISIADPNRVSKNDLQPIGKIGNKDVYFFSNTKHSYLTHFYEKYLLYFDSINLLSDWTGKNTKPQTLEEFIENYPILFFEDSFGRLIRLTKSNYIIPYVCEPIIYLYTEEQTDVEIRFVKNVSVSEPPYLNKWLISASPEGIITDKTTGFKYPYLFWEGTLDYLPDKKDGFVIKKEDIPQKLPQILTRLGLNDREIKNFTDAWLPKLSTAPYYFITFFDTEFLDVYAPIDVNPKPDTVIRILMMYKPLPSPMHVPEFQYSQIPSRKGFTLIEWGGIE